MGDGYHESLRMRGEIDLTLPSGDLARIVAFELRKEGGFREAEGAATLTLEGTTAQLRKLAAFSEAWRAMLVHLEGDHAEGAITLAAPHDLRAEMAQAARRLPEGSLPNELLADGAWATLAFAFARYEPVSVSVVTSRS